MVSVVASDHTPIPTFNQVHYLQLMWFDLTHATHTTHSHTRSLFLLPLTDCSLHRSSFLWLCAVIGHTALALLVVSPAVACGGAVQAAGLINPEASAVSSKLQLCFPTMTSPPPILPTQAQPPQLHFLPPFSACFNVLCMEQ